MLTSQPGKSPDQPGKSPDLPDGLRGLAGSPSSPDELRDRLGAPLRQERARQFARYYQMHRQVLQALVDEHVAKGHRIALLASDASQNDSEALVFSDLFDPDGTLFSHVASLKKRQMGNPQKKYPEKSLAQTALGSDAIFVFFASLYPNLFGGKRLIAPEFVSVEDAIWQSVAAKNARRLAGGGTGVESAAGRAGERICSLTILYKPDDDVIDAVASYAPLVDKAIVFDNSPVRDEALHEKLKAISHVEVRFGNGVNYGMCPPINQAIELAKREGFDWLITFDQDSIAGPNMIENMRAFAASPQCTPNIALVGPIIHKSRFVFERCLPLPELTYRNRIIQSGMMHRVSLLDQIGPYDERLFIDEVENDFCARVHLAGYDIVRVNKAPLLHQIHDKNDDREIDKYSPLRCYYRARNMSYVLDKYQQADPRYAAATLGGLYMLGEWVRTDRNPGEKALAIMLGFKHYAEGKWPRYEEALEELSATIG